MNNSNIGCIDGISCLKYIKREMITEPCSTLATPSGTLTSEGHRVLGCISGGALAVATGNFQLLSLAPAVGCGGSSSSFTSNSGNNDIVGNIIGGLFR